MDDKTFRQLYRQMTIPIMQDLECNGDIQKKVQQKQEFISSLRLGPIAAMPSEANKEMYEVPTAFYQLILGKRMKYSCSLFANGEESIDEAEDAMLDLVCQRSRLADGMKVMDLGCGWGALTFWILEKYKSCHVTSVSNSKTQKVYIDSLAKEKGVTDQVNCITADVNDFDTTEKFDRIISIEMFEYMTNYELLMAKIAKWLKSDGLLFTHTLGHHEYAYNLVSKSRNGCNSWMNNFFSGVNSVSSDLLLYFQKDLLIAGQWVLKGSHFFETARAWLRKLDANKNLVLEIFEDAYGRQYGKEHLLRWRMLFLVFQECFSFNGGNEWIICHQLFCKRHLPNA